MPQADSESQAGTTAGPPLEIDPSNLAPIDYYWWQMEQGEQGLQSAVISIDTYEEAMRFARGMRDEIIDEREGGQFYNPAITVRKRVAAAIGSALENPEGVSSGEQTEGIKLWGVVMSDLTRFGDDDRTPIDQRVGAKLQFAAKEIADARSVLGELLASADEAARQRFELTPDEIEELEHASRGATLEERCGDRQETIRKITEFRASAVGKLGAKSLTHAIRLAIENGILILDKVCPDEPEVELHPDHLETLKLASNGWSAKKIGEKRGEDIFDVYRQLGGSDEHNHGGAKARLHARNRPHLIRKAFEVGVLVPKKPGPSFLIRNELHKLNNLEANFAITKRYLDNFLPAGTSGEAPAQAEQLQPAFGPVFTTETDTEELLSGVRDNIFVAAGALHEVTGEIADLLADGRNFARRIGPARFSEDELAEMEAASEGLGTKTRDDPEAVRKTRFRLNGKLGSSGMAETVSITLGDGYLAGDWANGIYGPPAISDPWVVQIITLAARGLGSNEIARIAPFSRVPVERRIRAAKAGLGAGNRVHLVRRAIEQRVITPGGSNELLHRAFSAAIASEVKVSKIGKKLSVIDPVDLTIA